MRTCSAVECSSSFRNLTTLSIVLICRPWLFHAITWSQFHQSSMRSFYASRSRKCNISVKSSVFFYAFGIHVPKSCSKNIDEIDHCSQFHLHLRTNFLYKSALCSFSLVMFWLCNFLYFFSMQPGFVLLG
jgi:hypothetical protein